MLIVVLSPLEAVSVDSVVAVPVSAGDALSVCLAAYFTATQHAKRHCSG